MELPGNKNKSVLIIVQNLPVPFDRRVWLEATSLKRAGYKVSVICPKKYGYDKRFEELEGISIYRYPLLIEANRSAFAYLLEFLSCFLFASFLSLKAFVENNFNVLHICNPPETYFSLALFYKLLGVKVVFDHHDLSPEMYMAKDRRIKQSNFYYRLLLLFERFTFKVSDIVIATNKSHKKIAAERGNIPEDKIYIVRSGPDMDRFNGYLYDESLKKGKKYLICYLGEMCKQDGVEEFLIALSNYKSDYLKENTQFTFVGKGPEQPYLSGLVEKLNLQSYVNFTGRVSDQVLANYLCTADVCFDTSPYNAWTDKSTMNKIIEYMAFGNPIISFRLTETRYSANGSALFAEIDNYNDFFEKLIYLLSKEEKRKEMGEKGKSRFHNNLSWKHSEVVLLSAYESLLGE